MSVVKENIDTRTTRKPWEGARSLFDPSALFSFFFPFYALPGSASSVS
jgi:hypothetical protein